MRALRDLEYARPDGKPQRLDLYLPEKASGPLPLIVWIHGGGFTPDGALNYDGTKLAANGIVVVTINYRLGAFGFLAHPALASHPGGPSGNYGLTDQQAALRWIRHNMTSTPPGSG